VPASRSASAETHTTRRGNPPRRSAPARALPPSAPLGLGRSECQEAAPGHRPSECIDAGPAAADTCLRAVPREARRAFAPRRIARRQLAFRDPRRLRRGSVAHAAMPPGGRHASRSDPSGHESAAPGIAWPRPRVAVAIGALCRWGDAHRGGWNRTCRSCPRAYLLRRRDHRRDPLLPLRSSSQGSALLWSPRIPAARRSISPSAYTTRRALTRAAQTGLSCSVRLPAHVLRPLPRRDLRRVHLRTEASQTWPSPRRDRLGSRMVNLSRLQASLDVAARVLAPSEEAWDTPLETPRSLPAPGVCYSALRRLPRRDLHPLETNSVKQTICSLFLHDAPRVDLTCAWSTARHLSPLCSLIRFPSRTSLQPARRDSTCD